MGSDRAIWRLGASLLAIAATVGCGGVRTQPMRFRLPAGFVRVAEAHGLTVRLPAGITGACDRLVQWNRLEHVDRAVVCPPLVPIGPLTQPPMPGGEGEAAEHDVRQGYGVQAFSASLRHANGGHWSFAAGTPAALKLNLNPPPPEVPPGQPPASQVTPLSRAALRLVGLQATVYRMPSFEQGGGIYGGHVVIAWTFAGVAYQVSVHGYNNANKARLMAEAWIRKIHAVASG